jgi:hypothetical protein
MKYTMLGEPRPMDAAEIEAVWNETGLVGEEVEAEISYDVWRDCPADEVNMTGYTAEVRNLEDGETVFTTHGFKDRETLVASLAQAGIEEVVDLTH